MGLEAALRRALDDEDLMVKGRDLDETRRLMYMLLLVPRTEKYTLAGTLVNALTHHNVGVNADEAADRIVAWLNDQDADSELWIRDRIAELTELAA